MPEYILAHLETRKFLHITTSYSISTNKLKRMFFCEWLVPDIAELEYCFVQYVISLCHRWNLRTLFLAYSLVHSYHADWWLQLIKVEHPSTYVGFNPVITSTWCPMKTVNAGEASLEVLIAVSCWYITKDSPCFAWHVVVNIWKCSF